MRQSTRYIKSTDIVVDEHINDLDQVNATFQYGDTVLIELKSVPMNKYLKRIDNLESLIDTYIDHDQWSTDMLYHVFERQIWNYDRAVLHDIAWITLVERRALNYAEPRLLYQHDDDSFRIVVSGTDSEIHIEEKYFDALSAPSWRPVTSTIAMMKLALFGMKEKLTNFSTN